MKLLTLGIAAGRSAGVASDAADAGLANVTASFNVRQLSAKGKLMIRTTLTAAALAMLVTAAAGDAAACRDAKGHFTKCAPAATATTAVAPSVTKDAKGKCHIASGPKKGQFTKC